MKRNYQRALQYEKEEIDVKFTWKSKRSSNTVMNGLYLVLHVITVTNDEIARAVDVTVKKSSVTNFASRSGEHFKNSTVELFLNLRQEKGAQYGKNVLHTIYS